MKSLIFHHENEFSVNESPVPEIGESDVLVKVIAAGICGTDMHILHGEHMVKFPVIPGHEFSGEIAEVGREVSNVRVGDRVTIDPNIVDRTCAFCRRGEINLCRNLTAVGVNSDGGFAEFCRVPAEQVYKVPDSVDIYHAAMTEPLACCLHGIDRANIAAGSTVAILGAGTIGLLILQLARIAGAGRIIVSEPDPMKRDLAGGLGADVVIDPCEQDVMAGIARTDEDGADVVIEAAGRPETAELAPKLARRGGTVLQFGVVSQDKLIQISPYDIFFKELTLLGAFVNPYTHARAIELLASGLVDVAPLITHRFPIEEAAKALGTAGRRDAIKILILPQ
jgi:2-desacetyl-2-hydroxyethyl bacteriochlorophyllide A dehydrogenase